jgi:hypothetical protein
MTHRPLEMERSSAAQADFSSTQTDGRLVPHKNLQPVCYDANLREVVEVEVVVDGIQVLRQLYCDLVTLGLYIPLAEYLPDEPRHTDFQRYDGDLVFSSYEPKGVYHQLSVAEMSDIKKIFSFFVPCPEFMSDRIEKTLTQQGGHQVIHYPNGSTGYDIPMEVVSSRGSNGNGHQGKSRNGHHEDDSI